MKKTLKGRKRIKGGDRGDPLNKVTRGLDLAIKQKKKDFTKKFTGVKKGLTGDLTSFKKDLTGEYNASKEDFIGESKSIKEGLKNKGKKILSSSKKLFSGLPFFGNNDDAEEFQGSSKGEYLNENYKTELPYIKEYIPELDAEEIEKKKKVDKIKVKKAEADYIESKKILKKDEEKKFIEKENDKKIELQKFTANLSSSDARDLRNFLTFAGIMAFIATSSKETISKIVDILGELLPFILKIINSDIIIKHIIPMAVIICTILFIMYIMGFKVNTGKAPAATTTNPTIIIANSKPEYSKSETSYDKFMKIIMSIPGLKNLFSNYKDIRSRLSNTLGGIDTLEEYSIDRNFIKSGRNDNIYNIKLAKYFDKKDEDVYSIIVPADLEIKYEDNKDLLTDFNTLPKNIQDKILKDKNNIKLKWDLENNKYIMRCNNIKDEKGNNVDNLYRDCSKKAQLSNNSYDKERERLEYNDLNALVPLNI